MDRVSHFEVPYDDKDRMEKFYSEVFGWQFFPAPTEMPYSFAITTAVDDKFQPTEVGAINGGCYQRGGDDHPHARTPVIVIEVDSCSDRIARIEERGGSVVVPETIVGDMGVYAQVQDSEGNIIGLWQSLASSEQV